MANQFQFHYVKTPTGTISGQSVLTQTEDAINDLGQYMAEATQDATDALTQATQAVNTANTASQNASQALSTANSALGTVNTLSVTVNSWNTRISTAESNASNALTTANQASNNASQAVTTSNSALETAQQAVTTANGASQTAQQASASAAQAVGTAGSALTTAQQAVQTAQQAVTDTDAIRDEINSDMETINEQVAAATTQAQNAAASASSAASAAQSAVDDATEMLNAVVAYIPQNLTEDQQAQARENIAGVGFEDYATASTGGVVKVTGTDGITINSSGVIAVDFDAMPPEQMEQVVLSMVQEGGGISVDRNGQLYVDFASMPTNKFEDMLKSIRVPIWLTANKQFYVNGTSGSDNLDEGRGESASLPFKTISACVKYVTDNYNISSYIAYINVTSGTYTVQTNTLLFPDFNSTSGYIVLRGSDGNNTVTIYREDGAAPAQSTQGVYEFRGINFSINANSQNGTRSGLVLSCFSALDYSDITFNNCNFTFTVDSDDPPVGFVGRIIQAFNYANVNLSGTTTIKAINTRGRSVDGLFAAGNSRISILGGSSTQYIVYVSGDIINVTHVSTGQITANTNGPQIDATVEVPENETLTGRRYRVEAGGSINTNGGGAEYFPGTTEGVLDTSTYCWYK